MVEIGKPEREIVVEPVTEPKTQPVQEPAPQRKEEVPV
jgi:hypothetical protein